MTKVAYSYIRFSSKKQELGDSLRRQVQMAEAYAAKMGWKIEERSFRDLGLSAFRGKNAREGALGAFMKAVEDKIIPKGSVLLVEHLDRVTRADPPIALELFTGILNRGIEIVTVSDEQHYTAQSLTNNIAQLYLSIGTLLGANAESKKKSDRVSQAIQAKRNAGRVLTGRAPAWLVLKAGYKGAYGPDAWTVLPDVVATVQRIFELGAAGFGSTYISDVLNETETPTLGSAKYWNPLITRKVMRNSSVMGRFTSKYTTQEPIENYFPTVVDPNVYWLVQSHMKTRSTSGGPITKGIANLFKGLMFCECGAKFRFVGLQKDRGYGYVQCIDSYSNVDCNAPRIPYHVIEEDILSWFGSYKNIDPNLGGEFKSDPTVALVGTLRDKQQLMEGYMKGFEMTQEKRVPIPALVDKMMKLQGEIDDLHKAITNTKKRVPLTKHDLDLFDPHRVGEVHQHAMLKFFTALGKGDQKALDDTRTKFQASLARLITRITFLKDFKRCTDKSILGYPKTHKMKEPTFYGEYDIQGQMIELIADEVARIGKKPLFEIRDSSEEGRIIRRKYELPESNKAVVRRMKGLRAVKNTSTPKKGRPSH
jgi:DNA invertase Pin-like site-specific DNA recombinase